MLEILKRPRNNIHVPLFNVLKKELKKNLEDLALVHKTLSEVTEQYEKINNFSYLFHYNKDGDIIILDEKEETIIHFKSIKLKCEEE